MISSSSSSTSAVAVARAPLKPAQPRPAEARARRQVSNASSSSSSSTSVSSSSTSTSIEAPRGCLRYILPRSKILTPKSTKPGCLNVRDGNRRFAAANPKAKAKPKPKPKPKSSLERSGKDGDGAGKKRFVVGDVGGVLSTPIMKDFEAGDEKENGSGDNVRDGKENTPPVQASVSPEIQCGSACAALGYLSGGGLVTPIGRPCYGAGHLLSGIIDKRKCRPRGVLTVRDVDSDSDSGVRSKIFSSTDCSDDASIDNTQNVDRSAISAVLLPCEASMQWVLSPLDERENEEQRRCSSGSGTGGSVTPCSSSGLSKYSEPMSISPGTSGRDSLCRNLSLASPRGLSGIEQLLKPESMDGGCLSPTGMTPIIRMVTSTEDEIPFTMDCLSDGNVILTPHSHSSSGTQLRRSWHEDHYEGNDAEVDLLAEVLHKATLSPKCSCSPWVFSTDLGIRGCIDLANVQDIVDSKTSWMSASTLENSSQSQLRISWRDGLNSRMLEMDEYDCCRFLSDDEEDSQVELKPQTRGKENLGTINKDDANSGVTKLLYKQQEAKHEEQKDEADGWLGKQCTAESMNFSREGLTTSSDSDWNLCYKNKLFRS
ncbi:hypothetical protein MLD38_016850 [Melastoma candidum]|uniref:Uncharacterized protein n=1 Tax=Melastoma candidum TaxID=119954 RepID=A0ACB9QNU2_9MYRT|nr:hypothetical protein MLD38_016850 [Melastoma candidum]